MIHPFHYAIRFTICLIFLFGLIHVAEGYAQQHRRVDNGTYTTYWEFEAQEKHLDAVDKVSQDNKDKIQQILVRIEGDEDYVKGGSFILMALVSVGALKLFRGKTA